VPVGALVVVVVGLGWVVVVVGTGRVVVVVLVLDVVVLEVVVLEVVVLEVVVLEVVTTVLAPAADTAGPLTMPLMTRMRLPKVSAT
jgi:hypothetical protein